MRVEQLRSFIRVYETGSFTAAANSLFTEQPVITKQVAQLEKELGYPLFKRTTRKVEPTHEADILYPKVRDSVLLLDQGMGNVKAYIEQTRPDVRVGYAYLYMDPLTTSWVKEFERENDISVKITESSLQELIEKMTSGIIDCAFFGVTDPDFIPSYLGKLLIRSMGEVILMGKSHRLASRESLALDNLHGEDFVYPVQAPTPENSIVLKDFADIGKRPHISTTQFESSAMRLIELGNYIMNVPEEASGNYEKVLRIPYASENTMYYYFVWNRGNKVDVFRRFAEFIKEKVSASVD